MSDLLFFKRLSDTLWLGLRVPANLKVLVGASKPEIASDWTYDATSWPPEVLTACFFTLDYQKLADINGLDPSAVFTDPVSGEKRALQFVFKKFDCKASPEVPPPYSLLEAIQWRLEDLRNFVDQTALNDIDAAKRRLGDFITEHRRSPTAPLNLPALYKNTTAERLAAGDDNQEVRLPDPLDFSRILGFQNVPIELLSGLLFFVTTDPKAIPSGSQVLADPYIESKAGRRPVTLVPTQRVDRIDFKISVDSVLQSNIDVPRMIFGHADQLATFAPDTAGYDDRKKQLDEISLRFAPSFSVNRTLGLLPGKARGRNRVEIPTQPPTAHPAAATDRTGLSNEQRAELSRIDLGNWDSRHFQFSDNVAPELTGELLNYDVEFFNPHGRCTHYARLVVVRRDLSPPAAPSNGTAQLLVDKAGHGPTTCRASLTVPKSASSLRGGVRVLQQAELVLYSSDCDLVPTGFYGDADDAALAIARAYSDLDPAALLGPGAAQLTPVSDLQDEVYPERRLSRQGLREIEGVTFEPVATGAPVQNDVDLWAADVPWTKLMPSAAFGKGVILYAALRRKYDNSGIVDAKDCPESPLVQLKLEICAQDATGRALPACEVQHFEPFWDLPPVMGGMEAGHARVAVLQQDATLPADRPTPARIRITIDHKSVLSKLGATPLARMAVGGYRLWVRERRSSGHAWECVSVLQAVPPLVKAYAPLEGGRLWSLEPPTGTAGSVERPQWLDALPKDIYVQDPPSESTRSKGVDDTTLAQILADGTLLLAHVQRLASAGEACEVLLSVSARRRLETGDFSGLPLANWLLLRDQNERLLGRAYVIWGPDAAKLDKRHTLTERPSAHDTLGIDDFGRINWTWTGLSDLWSHDLEWVVEKLSRSAPLMQSLDRLLHPGSSLQDRFLHPGGTSTALLSGALGQLVPSALETYPRHSITVSRREPVPVGRFQLVQVLEDAGDAFVFRVVAPPEVLQSTHNALVRTGRGAYAFTAIGSQRQFRWKTDFPGTLPDDIVRAWCDGEWKEPEARPDIAVIAAGAPRAGRPGDYGELTIDEPSCMVIGVRTHMTVDNLQSKESFELRDVVRANPPLPPADHFAAGARLRGDIPTLTGATLLVPLARLEWGYEGQSSPSTKLAFDAGQLGALNRPLMRLPDPRAYAIAFVKHGATFVPIARFYGPQLEPLASEIKGMAQVDNIAWGRLFVAAQVKASMPVASGFECGKLKMVFEAVAAENLRVQWLRDGSDLLLNPFKVV